MALKVVADPLFPGAELKPRRKTPDGVATSDLVYSAYQAGNAEVFPLILQLHVPPGSKVADVTYGKGVFWHGVKPEAYKLAATDIKTGVDCRALPYADHEMDAVVLDPPYMEGLFRDDASLAGDGHYAAFREHYSNGLAPTVVEGTQRPKWHDAVLHFYLEAITEATRVLRDGGVLIVKCQDEVSANVQRLTHVELINALVPLGYYCKDLFVVMRSNRAAVSRLKSPQAHARKNHSYFLVFVKTRKPPHSQAACRADSDSPSQWR